MLPYSGSGCNIINRCKLSHFIVCGTNPATVGSGTEFCMFASPELQNSSALFRASSATMRDLSVYIAQAIVEESPVLMAVIFLTGVCATSHSTMLLALEAVRILFAMSLLISQKTAERIVASSCFSRLRAGTKRCCDTLMKQ